MHPPSGLHPRLSKVKEVCRTSSLPSQLLLWNFRGLASEERGRDNTSPHMLFHQNCFLFLLKSGRKPASFSGTVYIPASLKVWPLCDHIMVCVYCCYIHASLEGKHELQIIWNLCTGVVCPALLCPHCRHMQYTLLENKSDDG